MINGKKLFDQPVKNDVRTYNNIPKRHGDRSRR